MELVTPAFGLIFWQTVVFLLLLFILGKFAWKPITGAIAERNKSIEDSLKAAEKARDEMMALQNQNEELLRQARAEREKMLKDAQASSNKLLDEARNKAVEEGHRLLEEARNEIDRKKQEAVHELKNQVAVHAIAIAEKILREKLGDANEQNRLTSKYLNDITLN